MPWRSTPRPAAVSPSNTVLVPHTPNTLTDLFGPIRNAIVAGSELVRHPSPPLKTNGDDNR